MKEEGGEEQSTCEKGKEDVKMTEVRRDQQTGRGYVHHWYRALKMNLAVFLTATVYPGLVILNFPPVPPSGKGECICLFFLNEF